MNICVNMKQLCLRLAALIFCVALVLTSMSCQANPNAEAQGSETLEASCATTVAETETLSPEAQLTLEREDYLATVTYRNFVLTGEETPYFVGRWFDKEIQKETHKVTLTDGAHLYFLIENATSFDVNFTVITTGEEPYFAYSIDGAEPVRQHITQPTVTLPDAGRHTVRIIADGMTEGEGKWNREKGFALKSVTPAEGGCIVGIKPTEKVIFFYGDSITEGIRALNMNATSDGNSATNAYSWQCAETLGVTPYLVGYGASGMIATGSFSTMKNAIDYMSRDREVGETPTPDVIVINHGTNDGGYASDVFGEALVDTLTHLRETYPNAPIVYLIPFNQAQARAIRDTLSTMENAYVIETRGWKITYTDGVHPDAAGAKVAGGLLADQLTSIFGQDFFKS